MHAFPRAPSGAPAGISWRSAASRLSSTTCSPPGPRPGAAGRGATCAAAVCSGGRRDAPALLRPCSNPAPGPLPASTDCVGRPAAARAGQRLSTLRSWCYASPAAPSYISHISGDLKLDTDFLRKHFGFVFTRWYWFQGVLLRRTQLCFH